MEPIASPTRPDLLQKINEKKYSCINLQKIDIEKLPYGIKELLNIKDNVHC